MKRTGSTVVELILYMGLLSVFLLMLFELYGQVLSNQTRSASVSLVQQNANFVLNKLTHDIRQADSIISPAGIGASSSVIVLRNGGLNQSYQVINHRLVFGPDIATASALNDADTRISNFRAIRVGNPDGKNTLILDFTVESILAENSGTRLLNIHTATTTR